MDQYEARQYNKKLIVTIHEYQKMMMVAEEGSSDRHLFNVPDTTPIQRNKRGMLIKGRGSLEGQFCQPAGADSMYNEGSLNQEIGIPNTPARARPRASVTPSPQSSDIGDRLCSKVREMTAALQHNPAAMEALFAHVSQMHETILSSDSKLVSFPATDFRKKGKRLRGAGEFDREKHRKKMKQTETVSLSMSSSRLDI